MSLPITRLRLYREKHFLNLVELGAKADVSIGTISNAENGKKISLGCIKKLAKALRVKPSDLL